MKTIIWSGYITLEDKDKLTKKTEEKNNEKGGSELNYLMSGCIGLK